VRAQSAACAGREHHADHGVLRSAVTGFILLT